MDVGFMFVVMIVVLLVAWMIIAVSQGYRSSRGNPSLSSVYPSWRSSDSSDNSDRVQGLVQPSATAPDGNDASTEESAADSNASGNSDSDSDSDAAEDSDSDSASDSSSDADSSSDSGDSGDDDS